MYSEGKCKQVFKPEPDPEKYSVDEECVIAAHVERFMNLEYPEPVEVVHIATRTLEAELGAPEMTYRKLWILLLKTEKTEWTILNKWEYRAMVYKFGKWLRKNPMPKFSKFEAHKPNVT